MPASALPLKKQASEDHNSPGPGPESGAEEIRKGGREGHRSESPYPSFPPHRPLSKDLFPLTNFCGLQSGFPRKSVSDEQVSGEGALPLTPK